MQRSPSYIKTIPNRDPTAEFLKRWIPISWVVGFLRLQYIFLGYLFVTLCQKYPAKMRKDIRAEAKEQLPKRIGIDPHFDPKYGYVQNLYHLSHALRLIFWLSPWDQRMCLVPDGDFYKALHTGKADIVTGHIETVNDHGIVIKDQPDNRIDVDIIVTATGLRVLTGGGTQASIDGKPVRLADKMLWRNCMVQDLPNAVNIVGYTNASWTLGASTAATVSVQRPPGYY